MAKIISLILLLFLGVSFGQTTGKKTSELTARALVAGDRVIVMTAAGGNAAGNVGDGVIALQAEDARTDNPHAVTQAQVGLPNVDDTSDANKPISATTQTALDLLAPIASPTFTGTVVGITKAMVGLVNVDNTSDANKPISTTTQAALDVITGNTGSATYDPPALADGSGVTTTVTVTGAALGEFAVASFGVDIQGVTVSAWVSATNTASVRFQNETGGAIDLASGTLSARAN